MPATFSNFSQAGAGLMKEAIHDARFQGHKEIRASFVDIIFVQVTVIVLS